MKKDDNSGVSIKQIMITAMFLVVTTFGGLNIYRIAYDENSNAIQTIESANFEKKQFESALVENTKDDFIYRENVKYLSTNLKAMSSGSTVSRGNLLREPNIGDIVENSVSTNDNKLLNSVLNGIKEISEIQEAIINNTGLAEKKEISEENKLTEAHQTVNNEEISVNEEIKVSEKLLANKEITSDEENKVSEETKNIAEREGIPTEYIKTIDVKATAYCLCKKCCGKSPSNPAYGYTASGLKITPGIGMKVVASDPSVIPLGTQVYVEGLYGAKDYGYAVVADTGSAIKNMKIDLYMDTHQMALNCGVKTVRVYILGK